MEAIKKKNRSTKAKQAVMNVFADRISAISHAELYTLLSDTADRATIYRILINFADEGILHKIVGNDGVIRFAKCDASHCHEEEHNHSHLHFACNACQKVTCMEDEVEFKLPKGFILQETNFIVSGVCSECNI